MREPIRTARPDTEPEALVLSAACRVFGDLALALTWLSHANRALGGNSPIQCVVSSGDASKVLQLLGRFDLGVYS